jgi:hypothetical protein
MLEWFKNLFSFRYNSIEERINDIASVIVERSIYLGEVNYQEMISNMLSSFQFPQAQDLHRWHIARKILINEGVIGELMDYYIFDNIPEAEVMLGSPGSEADFFSNIQFNFGDHNCELFYHSDDDSMV